jgi:glycosyltransferase involved in cell wall biosynthesis
MSDFHVSVIIPVYNAATFIQYAVESALSQPETAEIILVEDHSLDQSWEICQRLAASHAEIHLFRHSDGGNHGAGATRNLGIEKSQYDYIAFLDADDYYLPGRFVAAKELFEADPDLEGVYEAVALHLEDEAGARRWEAANRPSNRLHTMSTRVAPEELFATLVRGTNGSFHLDGFTIKRDIIQKTGRMDDDLPLHQDSAFMIKAAAVSRLTAGRLDEPVAEWRIHDHNRFSAPRTTSEIYTLKLKYWYTLWQWSRSHLKQEFQQSLLDAMINEAKFRTRFNRPVPKKLYGIQQRIQLSLLLFYYPEVIKETIYWRAFLPKRSSSKPDNKQGNELEKQ